jgi:membrane protein YqaA with SNARE-associated domain
MSLSGAKPRDDDDTAEPKGAPRPALWHDLLRYLIQLALGLGAFVGLVSAAAYFARAELEALGRTFVRHFGVAGMFLGTFLADAFSFPIPPQFYMLTAISAGESQLAAMVAICAASMIAGCVGYLLAGRLARVRLFARRIEASRAKVDRLIERYGYWAIVLGGLTPIPFSVLCYLSGLYRIPARCLAVLIMTRVPRLLVFYALIRAGFGQ